MLTLPKCLTVSAAHKATAARSATSTWVLVTSASAPSSSTVSSRPTLFQSDSASLAPRDAASCASARPIPLPAPVMATTFPFRSRRPMDQAPHTRTRHCIRRAPAYRLRGYGYVARLGPRARRFADLVVMGFPAHVRGFGRRHCRPSENDEVGTPVLGRDRRILS